MYEITEGEVSAGRNMPTFLNTVFTPNPYKAQGRAPPPALYAPARVEGAQQTSE